MQGFCSKTVNNLVVSTVGLSKDTHIISCQKHDVKELKLFQTV